MNKAKDIFHVRNIPFIGLLYSIVKPHPIVSSVGYALYHAYISALITVVIILSIYA